MVHGVWHGTTWLVREPACLNLLLMSGYELRGWQFGGSDGGLRETLWVLCSFCSVHCAAKM